MHSEVFRQLVRMIGSRYRCAWAFRSFGGGKCTGFLIGEPVAWSVQVSIARYRQSEDFHVPMPSNVDYEECRIVEFEMVMLVRGRIRAVQSERDC